ncbi:MAG TPA: hypothetical protein VE913_19680, partial [Longimicrobium sp.]|nr:hypothetical protein [Longimicrobium sp.]
GEPFFYLADIVAALDRAHGEREFQLRAHLGNFALWLAGCFPDHVTHRVHRRGAPGISYYDELGAAGFRAAASSSLAPRHGLGEIFADVAEHFSDVRSALNSLSDTVLFPHPRSATDRILRQVADDFNRRP